VYHLFGDALALCSICKDGATAALDCVPIAEHGEEDCHTTVFSYRDLSHYNFMVHHRIPCANY